ncbi:MAG: DUF4286 family protein [Muribaculaceae bacterium]|nr:DUF4286 family protein [Muribaculaceae bacterium]
MMTLLNTTFSIDDNVLERFKTFVADVIAPAAKHGRMEHISLGAIQGARDVNAITGQPASSYALQMYAPSRLVLKNYMANIEPALMAQLMEQFGTGVAMFTTAIDIIWTADDAK